MTYRGIVKLEVDIWVDFLEQRMWRNDSLLQRDYQMRTWLAGELWNS